jgi:hypothetical protein
MKLVVILYHRKFYYTVGMDHFGDHLFFISFGCHRILRSLYFSSHFDDFTTGKTLIFTGW